MTTPSVIMPWWRQYYLLNNIKGFYYKYLHIYHVKHVTSGLLQACETQKTLIGDDTEKDRGICDVKYIFHPHFYKVMVK